MTTTATRKKPPTQAAQAAVQRVRETASRHEREDAADRASARAEYLRIVHAEIEPPDGPSLLELLHDAGVTPEQFEEDVRIVAEHRRLTEAAADEVAACAELAEARKARKQYEQIVKDGEKETWKRVRVATHRHSQAIDAKRAAERIATEQRPDLFGQ